MKRTATLLIASIFMGLTPLLSHAQYLVSSEFLSENNAFVLGSLTGLDTEYDVNYYQLTYNTTNTAGEPTVASGAVGIPISTTCNSFPLIAYCHGTVLRQLNVPSQENLESLLVKAMASSGYIAVAPDYLGLGENAGIHPYVHAESEATATIDLIRATREFLESQPEQDNGEVFITGYSQGGQAAMATLQYAEENNLNSELGIVAGAPCSGPYDLSGSQAEVLLSDEPYSNPGYVIYLLISYQLAYGNLYADLGDIIQSPYADLVAPYFDGAQNSYDMGVVNAILPDYLSELLVDTVYANFQSNPNHPLWLDLEDNDTYNWTPQVPLRMYYCTGDEQVSYQNSLTADSTMNANGATDVQAINAQAGASHGQCVFPALTNAMVFFNDLASPCDFVSAIATTNKSKLTIYPNPVSNVLNISVSEKGGNLTIHDTKGKVVYKQYILPGNTQIDLSTLASAPYIVSFQNSEELMRATIVVR